MRHAWRPVHHAWLILQSTCVLRLVAHCMQAVLAGVGLEHCIWQLVGTVIVWHHWCHNQTAACQP